MIVGKFTVNAGQVTKGIQMLEVVIKSAASSATHEAALNADIGYVRPGVPKEHGYLERAGRVQFLPAGQVIGAELVYDEVDHKGGSFHYAWVQEAKWEKKKLKGRLHYLEFGVQNDYAPHYLTDIAKTFGAVLG